MSEDRRARRILLTSHCVLNQNAVVRPLARSAGVVKSAVDWAYENGYGIIQLPCPEFAFLGPDRVGMTVEEYDTPEYHTQNRILLDPVIAQLQEYQRAGYEIVGALVVQESPSCDPAVGVWVGDLLAAADDAGVTIRDLWQIPNSEDGAFVSSDPAAYFGPASRRTVLPLTVRQHGGIALAGCRACRVAES